MNIWTVIIVVVVGLAAFLLGRLVGKGTRPELGRRPGARDPEEIEKEKADIADDLAEKEEAIDAAWKEVKEAWRDRYR